jgi:hypothetical protein
MFVDLDNTLDLIKSNEKCSSSGKVKKATAIQLHGLYLNSTVQYSTKQCWQGMFLHPPGNFLSSYILKSNLLEWCFKIPHLFLKWNGHVWRLMVVRQRTILNLALQKVLHSVYTGNFYFWIFLLGRKTFFYAWYKRSGLDSL